MYWQFGFWFLRYSGCRSPNYPFEIYWVGQKVRLWLSITSEKANEPFGKLSTSSPYVSEIKPKLPNYLQVVNKCHSGQPLCTLFLPPNHSLLSPAPVSWYACSFNTRAQRRFRVSVLTISSAWDVLPPNILMAHAFPPF